MAVLGDNDLLRSVLTPAFLPHPGDVRAGPAPMEGKGASQS